MASGAFAYGTVEIPNEKKYCSKLILVKKDRSLDEWKHCDNTSKEVFYKVAWLLTLKEISYCSPPHISNPGS